MATETGQPTYVKGQSQQGLIVGDQYAPTQPPNVNESDHNASDSRPENNQKKLIIIGIIAVIIIVAVVILAVTIEFGELSDDNHNEPYGWGGGDCGCQLFNQTFNWRWDKVCGEKPKNDVREGQCVQECYSIYDEDEIYDMYYIRNTSECYCATYMNYDECLDLSNTTDIQKWSYECCVFGRPYNIESGPDLKADIKNINCADYNYFDNDVWKDFVSNNNLSDSVMMTAWLKQGLSEHASIGTFAKFSLQLMSIGAPLWILRLSNEASLDEIKHTQLSFDIANMYNEGNDHGKCMIYNEFPEHTVSIDGDWKEIAKDTAIGGCIGETISAFKMIEKKYDNIIDEFVYEMAMDEITHAALGWITIKWMIDNVPDDVKIDVANKNWWKQRMKNVNKDYVNIVHGILNKIWVNVNVNDYQGLYKEIIDELQLQINMRSEAQCSF